MVWNYRIIKNTEGSYELVEELRDVGIILEKGMPVIQNGYTENLLTDVYESPKEIIRVLEMMLKDAKHYKPIKLENGKTKNNKKL